jgi:hypothetical protein
MIDRIARWLGWWYVPPEQPDPWFPHLVHKDRWEEMLPGGVTITHTFHLSHWSKVERARREATNAQPRSVSPR